MGRFYFCIPSSVTLSFILTPSIVVSQNSKRETLKETIIADGIVEKKRVKTRELHVQKALLSKRKSMSRRRAQCK